eukprot:Amastigsp_a680195_6.p5 type:complete len:124 gc:universal Amastigsp_a680195_6:1081-1452(+)
MRERHAPDRVQRLHRRHEQRHHRAGNRLARRPPSCPRLCSQGALWRLGHRTRGLVELAGRQVARCVRRLLWTNPDRKLGALAPAQHRGADRSHQDPASALRALECRTLPRRGRFRDALGSAQS